MGLGMQPLRYRVGVVLVSAEAGVRVAIAIDAVSVYLSMGDWEDFDPFDDLALYL